SILMACAQRLVRRVCTNCKEEFVPEPELIAKLALADNKNTVFYHGTGCDRCKGRGYLGRAALIEALPVSEAVRRLIIKRASAAATSTRMLKKPAAERLSKTVLPHATRSFSPPDPFRSAAGATSARTSAPPLELGARRITASPKRGQSGHLPPALARALEPKL